MWHNSGMRLKTIFLILLIQVVPFFGDAATPEIEITCTPAVINAFQGEKVILTVEIKNNTAKSLRPEANFFFSYHLYDREGKQLSFDNRRFMLPGVMRRKKTSTFKIPVYFDYSKGGRYIVEFDIVKEGEYWGSSKKWKTSKAQLRLKPLFSPQFKRKYLPTNIKTGNRELDREQYLLRMTLNNCELIKDGKVFGFAAGSTYPAVWIRDTATFIALAKKYYSFDILTGIIELFLEYQAEDGEIVDWVDISGKTDKNTVETDQESSLLLAAYEMARDNPKWLAKKIKGKPIYHRLEEALEWVWGIRRDKKENLITSGFTADWGDVENTYPDKRANKLSDKSTLVYGIYTQAKYIQAIDCFIKLAKEYQAGNNAGRIDKWSRRLKLLKAQTRKRLYLKDRGYYITHILQAKGKGSYYKAEKEMLAVGGNAEAILAGLMSREEVGKFLKQLELRLKEYKLRTVSFTLIPPYPEGFFPHHLLRHPWNYQNGGEWDWIGGRVVKAFYQSGYEKEAENYLLEIVKKNLANYCIFEWEDRGGTGKGALFYVGAAGVIGEAILKRGTRNTRKKD
ncbi:MAG: hypothetical protein GY757_11105 [bacterium]|nr:hypothetical protein [bacterium]